MDGTTFGKYILLEELGHGGMGVVHRAFQTDLKREVALKFMLGVDAEEIARFHREAETAARLNHPGIVPVYESGTLEGKHYLAMGLVTGVTFDRLLKERSRYTPAALVKALEEAARAVDYAHQQGVIHRDLKPSNVMIERPEALHVRKTGSSSATPRARVYVMDFGLAKSVKPGSSLTMSGMAVGTPQYMPPEQAMGQLKRVGPASDVYALGSILYEVLTGEPPFTGESAADIFFKIIDQDPVPPRKLDPRIAADLETVCLKALEKDPARRYASASEFADELARWLDGEPIVARPVSRLTRLWRRLRKQKLVTAAVLVAVISSVAGAGFGAAWLRQRWSQQERDRLRAEATPWFQEAAAAHRQAEKLVLMAAADVSEYRSSLEKAERLVGEAVARDPSFADAWVLLGQIQMRRHRPSEASASLTRALKESPGLPQALLHRGLARAAEYRRVVGEQSFSASISVSARGRDREGALRVFGTDPSLKQELLRELAADLDGAARLAEKPYERALARAVVAVAQWRPGDDEGPARQAVAEAQKAGPNEVEPVYLLASLAGRTDRLDEAVQAYERALALAPNDPRILFDFAATLHAGGRSKAAGVPLGRVLAIEKDAAVLNLKGMILATLGDHEAALQAYDESLRMTPPSVSAKYNRAYSLHLKGDDEAALASYAALVREKPLDAEIRSLQAMVLMSLNRLDEAIVALAEARDLDARNPDRWTNLGAVKSRANRLEEAEADYRKALEIDPAHRMSIGNYGAFLVKCRRYEEALTLLRKAAEMGKPTATLFASVGEVHGRLDRWKEAKEWFDRALVLDPNHVYSLAWRAASHLHLKSPDAALLDAERALAIDPRHAAALRHRGMAHLEGGKLAEGARDLEASLEIEEDGPSRLNVGMALSKLGRFDDAIRHLDRAIALNPTRAADAYASRAIAKVSKDDPDGALADATQAIEKGNRHPMLYRLRGEVHHGREEWKEARENLDVALAANARDPMGYAMRGEANLKLGEAARAVKDFDEALKSDAKWAGVLALRGRALLKLDRHAEALTDFEKAVKAEPGLLETLAEEMESARKGK